ncbi:MAG TPA: hypothetical protein VFT42_11190 [Solirubrobacteraceae bacterium]|nr:hypothetical protein [Solirubrobacteraceae bacterium]
MHTRQLHDALSAFAEEAAWQLSSETAAGAEVPFEVVEEGRGEAPLYCYRPLTGAFIAERTSMLARLPSYLHAVHALTAAGRLDAYLEARGERPAGDGRARADAVLHVFLVRIFEDSTDFALVPERFERAFAELRAAALDGRSHVEAIAPVLGLEIASEEVPLGDGLALVRGDLLEEAPPEARWARGAERPHVVAVLRWEDAPGDESPVSHARVRLRRLLTALRLFDACGAAFGPLGWTRSSGGAWQAFALGTAAPPEGCVLVTRDQEDELRAFCNLVARRTPRAGELAWALRRFEMACERPLPAEALTDHLLALRALLEPEGPGSARLAGRLAALCALPEHRPQLAERIAHIAACERAVVAGLAVDPQLDALVGELAGHLRALLRDVLCGHLDPDLRTLADRIVGEATAEQPTLA